MSAELQPRSLPVSHSGLGVGHAAPPEHALNGIVSGLVVPGQVAAGQLLATALTVSLPGIDANDPPKSLACFRLYTVALCSIGALQVPDAGEQLSVLSHTKSRPRRPGRIMMSTQ